MWECGKRRYRFPHFHIDTLVVSKITLTVCYSWSSHKVPIRKLGSGGNNLIDVLDFAQGGNVVRLVPKIRTWLFDNTQLVYLMIMFKRPHAHNEFSRYGHYRFLDAAGVADYTPILFQKHGVFVIGAPPAFYKPSPRTGGRPCLVIRPRRSVSPVELSLLVSPTYEAIRFPSRNRPRSPHSNVSRIAVSHPIPGIDRFALTPVSYLSFWQNARSFSSKSFLTASNVSSIVRSASRLNFSEYGNSIVLKER